jgi:protein-disulfide isomerase
MQLRTPVSAQDHTQGPATAEVTLVEYGDYECPHCGRAYPVVKKLQQHFGDSLRFVFRNFPLSEMHPMAESAAEAAEFAGAQGKFWEIHDGIYEHQSKLAPDLLVRLAKKNDLDIKAFTEALNHGTFRERVKADFSSGVRSGVNGTPTFFINGHRHDGPFDYQSLTDAVEAAR